MDILDVWGDHLGIEGLELIVSLGCCLDATVDQIEGNETAYGFKKNHSWLSPSRNGNGGV
jgi:hypothetical protein